MTRRSLVAVLVALLVLTGCSGAGSEDPAADGPAGPTPSASASASAPSTTPPVEPPVPPPVPTRGVCHQMSYDQAVAPTNEAALADCAGDHTAETFAVGELRTVRDGHLLAVDSATVQRQVATTCPRRLARFVGGTPEDLRLSMLRAIWFTPTVAESDAGASWFRCDAIVIAQEDALATVRGPLEGALSTPAGRERFGMCGTDDPGAADFRRTLCRGAHTWRAIGTVGLRRDGAGAAYPGVEAVRAAGQGVCDDQAQAVASDALDYQWGYEWPTAAQWTAGQTYGRCWAPDPA